MWKLNVKKIDPKHHKTVFPNISLSLNWLKDCLCCRSKFIFIQYAHAKPTGIFINFHLIPDDNQKFHSPLYHLFAYPLILHSKKSVLWVGMIQKTMMKPKKKEDIKPRVKYTRGIPMEFYPQTRSQRGGFRMAIIFTKMGGLAISGPKAKRNRMAWKCDWDWWNGVLGIGAWRDSAIFFRKFLTVWGVEMPHFIWRKK